MLMSLLRSYFFVFLCIARSTYAERVCIDARRNPEFLSSPLNYAHFLLAQMYPIVVTLVEMGLKPDDMLEIATGEESAYYWESQLIEILAPWNTTVRRMCDSIPKAVVSVPHLAFCTTSYWEQSHIFSAFLRARFDLITPQQDDPLVLIVLRADKATNGKIGRAWDIHGLSSACQDKSWIMKWKAAGVGVECVVWTRSTPIFSVARTVGSASMFIAGHGAGLANTIFLKPGAMVIELDAMHHTGHNRHFYGVLDQDLSLHYTKVWLNAAGHRLPNLQPVRNCTDRRPDGSHIAGQSAEELAAAGILPYDAPTAIRRDDLDALVARAAPPWNLVWIHTSNACREELPESQWIVKVLLKDVVANFFIDEKQKIAIDRAVYIVHVDNDTPVEERRRIFELGIFLRSHNYRNVVLLHLSDERGLLDDFYDPWPLIIRQHWSPRLFDKWGEMRILFVPIAYTSQNDLIISPASGRPFNLAHFEYATAHTRLSQENAQTTQQMRSTRFCVFYSALGVWDALENGCIAIVTKGHGEYFKNFLDYLSATYHAKIDAEDPPIIQVTDDRTSTAAEAKQPSQIDSHQALLINWWTGLKAGLNTEIRRRLLLNEGSIMLIKS